MNQRLFSFSMVLMISGCSLLSPVEIDPPTKYLLDETPACLPKTHKQDGILLIQTPETRPIYNTTQMAYTLDPHQVAYFSYNEWGEPPSQMVQSLLMTTLQKTNAFTAVVTVPYSGPYDYVLMTRIQELIQDFTSCPAMFKITILAQLAQGSTNRIITQKVITLEEPIPEGTPCCGVIVANQIMEKALQILTKFVLKARQIKGASDAERRPCIQNDAVKLR